MPTRFRNQAHRLTLAAVAVLCLPLHPQKPKPTFQVRTANGQSTFHIGERIPLLLSFTGPGDKSFTVNTSSYDRSGRMNHDAFQVAPSTGTSDPLAAYFREGMFDGGGLFGTPELSPQPTEIPLDLNEWIRFDQPGDYQVAITTGRVSPARHAGASLTLTAGPVALHIIAATPEWQRATLERTLKTLNMKQPSSSPFSGDSEQRRAALADLRFLASPAAIVELAARLRDDGDGSYTASFGLMGLSAALSDTAIAALKTQLDEPSFPVSAQFLTTLTFLEAGSTGGLSFADRARQDSDRAATWQEAFAALSRKSGKARADTAQALLAYPPPSVTALQKAQVNALLGSSFLELSADKQIQQLQYGWDALRSPLMLPVLRVLAGEGSSGATGQSKQPYVNRSLRAFVLRRWFELEPAAAAPATLAQIGTDHPALNADDVSFLPEKSLPQFELTWASALTVATDYYQQGNLGSLLTRFGTGAATPQVAAVLSDRVGHMPCAPQAAALAYLVRFDPEAAGPFLARAIAARGEDATGCRHQLFREISTYTYGPVLTAAAVAAIGDGDAAVVDDALLYLTSYGDESARAPITARYEKWTRTWAGKADELERPDTTDPHIDWPEHNLGNTLAHALLANQGWIADNALTKLVLDRCVGEQMCRQLKSLTTHGNLIILTEPDWRPAYTIDSFQCRDRTLFEAKIAQFPKGTSFRIINSTLDDAGGRALALDAGKLLTDHGMKATGP